MGMYSSFNWEDIEVTDWKGLKEYLELFKSIDKDANETDTGWNEWFNKIIPQMVDNENKEPNLSFECWTELKLISYYYTPYLIFWEGLAKYIEGEVHWSFESEDEAGYVSFEDGECMVHSGQMDWQEWKPIENIKESDMSKEMKKMLMLNKLDAK